MLKFLPQIIMFIFIGVKVGVAILTHGTPKSGNYNFKINICAMIVTQALLYWGGFYNVFK
jgi:hypothetical protein